MKEAAGEANLTVIAIILIGVVAAVVTPLINSYLRSAAKKSCCTNAGHIWKSNACYPIGADGKTSSTATTAYWNTTDNTCAE